VAVVIDACLPVALMTADPSQGLVAARFQEWLTTGEDLVAPAVLPYEISNVLSRLVFDGTFDPGDVPRAWADLLLLGIRLEPFDVALDGPQVVSIAARLRRRQATDCAYISLALRLSSVVWTIDGRLARAAQAEGLPVQLLA